MVKKKGTKKFISRIKDKYRLVIYRDSTFEEVLHFRLSKLNIFSIIGSFVLLLIIGVTFLIAFTPIREFIPGYPDGNIRRNILMNTIKLDSLEHELQIRDLYFENLNNIISGKEPVNFENSQDTTTRYENISFTKSVYDSILRRQIEEEEQYNLSIFEDRQSDNNFSSMHFFAPVKGLVTNPFNAGENHYGTDIVAAPNEVVAATLDGTVIMAIWTLETGSNIQIQHKNNLISVYKHNAELLKKVGNIVKAGEAIAIIGSSGELTTGIHLHFELWYNGKPINPEDYIVF